MTNSPLHSGAADSAASDAAFPTSITPTPGVQETPAIADSTALASSQNDATPTPVTATRVQLPQLPHGIGLSSRQRIALQALAAGQSVRAASQLADVSETTLYRWRKYHPRFIAAWNTFEAETEKTVHDCLIAAKENAARTILQATRNGHVGASLAVLKNLGALTPAKPGPGFAEAVKRQLDDESDKIKAAIGGETHRQRQLRSASELERDTHLEECYQNFLNSYLKLPPLPRPVTIEAVRESVLNSTIDIDIVSTACSLTITAVTGDRKPLIVLCKRYTIVGDTPVERRLKSLPLLLDSMVLSAEAEQAARKFEAAGATVEVRPGWDD